MDKKQKSCGRSPAALLLAISKNEIMKVSTNSANNPYNRSAVVHAYAGSMDSVVEEERRVMSQIFFRKFGT